MKFYYFYYLKSIRLAKNVVNVGIETNMYKYRLCKTHIAYVNLIILLIEKKEVFKFLPALPFFT